MRMRQGLLLFCCVGVMYVGRQRVKKMLLYISPACLLCHLSPQSVQLQLDMILKRWTQMHDAKKPCT
jgi:hypothetical protein